MYIINSSFQKPKKRKMPLFRVWYKVLVLEGARGFQALGFLKRVRGLGNPKP